MKMHTNLLIRLITFGLIFTFNWVFAQEFTVSAHIYDVDNQPVSFANVLLLKQSDSSFVAGTSTDDKGFFEFKNITRDQYILNISFIGFMTEVIEIDLSENIYIENLILTQDAEALSEVNLTYKKPTVQKLPDRLTFNIANSPLVEGNILQVLKSTPGVLVMDGNIMVKSSSPTVYINNRKVQLTNRELSQLLENSSANSVKSIEVITNPSARYDADSGVVLNIVMAKNLVTGYRGDVFNNFTQGVFPRYNFGTGHFFKTDKININLNYSYTGNKIDRRNDDFVNFLDANNTIEEQWRSLIDRTTWSENHNINLNFDYYLTEKTTLSLTSTASVMPYFKYKINNNTSIRDNANNFLGGFTADNLSRDDRFNIGTDLDLKHNFENDAQLTINAHYTNYDYSRNQNVFSEFFDANNNFDRASEFRTLANQSTEIISSQIDYELPLSETASFETGVKFSNVQTNSDLAQFDRDLSTGDETLNTQNSDDFDYDEKVYAAYANYSKSWEKFSLNLGLRVEQTNIEGISDFGNTTNIQDYFEWFPNYSLQYEASDNFSIYTNYKRSLQRPSYTNLNPFRFFLNENYEVTGNPNLLPAFKNHFVIGTTLFNLFTVEAYYIRYDGNIVELPRQDNVTNIISFVPVNLDETVDFGFDFLTYFNVTDRWSVYFVNSIFNMRESTNFGDGFVDINQWSNYTVLSNDFTFLKDDSLSVNFALSLITTDLQNLMIIDERLMSTLSFSKTLFKKKAILSLTFEDLFNYQNFDARTQYLNQFNRNLTITDSRTVTLGFRYKFGNTGLQTNERGLSKDERDRIKDFN
jgi:hypothetical protein